MMKLIMGISFLVAGLAYGGTLTPQDGKTFLLPSGAAPGGRVIAKLKSNQPVRIRLNGKILGIFKPDKDVITTDFTPAVWYGAKNTVKCRPEATVISITYEDTVAEPAVIARLRKEKIRMNSSAVQSASRAAVLRETGFNMAMGWSAIHKGVKAKDYKEGDPLVSKDNMPRLDFVRREISLAKTQNIIPMNLMWYHKETQQIMDRIKYEKCRSLAFGTMKTPCPVDTVYWDQLIKPTLKAVAEVYRELDAPGGMMLDQEFYAGGYPGFTYGGAEDGCYCDSCKKAFLEAVGEDTDLSKIKGRFLRHVIKCGYTLDDYLGVLEIRIARKVREVALEVRDIKPDFLLGVMPGKSNWYTNGVGRGMATPGVPVFIMGEGEYTNGYYQLSRQNKENLKQWGWPSFYVPGLMISRFNAEGLGAKSVESAQHTDGYWLYYGEMLFVKNVRIVNEIRASEYALREPAKRYLDAMKTANAYFVKNPNPLPPPTKLAPFPAVTSSDFKITSTGLVFSDPTAVPANLLTEIPRYAKGIAKSEEGGIIFNMGKQGSNESNRTIKVESGKKYRMSLLAKATGLSLPVVGFRILENNKVIEHSILNCSGAPDWKELHKVFTPQTDSIQAKILAYGETGMFEFKDARLASAVPLNVTSFPLPAASDGLKLVIGNMIDAELFNPVTKTAYFRLNDEVNDLRLLRAIYGELPQVVRFSGDISDNINFTK